MENRLPLSSGLHRPVYMQIFGVNLLGKRGMGDIIFSGAFIIRSSEALAPALSAIVLSMISPQSSVSDSLLFQGA